MAARRPIPWGAAHIVLLLLCFGCAEDHEIRIRFANDALRTATVRLEVALIDSCETQTPGDSAFGAAQQNTFPIDEPIALGEIEHGEYGLYVRASSTDCEVVAAGCSPVTVTRTGGRLSVLLQPTEGALCSSGFTCSDAECVPTDGGVGDGDGGPPVDGGTCDEPIPTTSIIEHSSGLISANGAVCLIDEGRLFCFGSNNDDGQLGDSVPCEDEMGCLREVMHPEARAWAQVSVGSRFGCAIDDAQGLYCWGSNAFGQLGEPDATGAVARVGTFPAGRVSCGSTAVCAIKSDTKTVLCWGDTRSGQTGVTREGVCGSHPGDIVSLPTTIASPEESPCPPIAESTEVGLWEGLSSSNDTNCALLADGRAFCWGGVANGGTGRRELACFPACRSTPLAGRWKRLGQSVLHHRCGIRDDDSLICWSRNSHGELGLGFMTERNTDVDICDGDPDARGNEVLLHESAPVPHPTGARWVDVAAGHFHTCAVDDEGSVFCWGVNDNGVIGPDADRESLAPTRVALPDGALAAEVTVAQPVSCILTRDGATYCWGATSRRCAGTAECNEIHRVTLP